MNRFWVRLVARLPLADTTVLIEDGNAVARRGRPQAGLLSEIGDLAQSVGVATACIHATTWAGGYRLRFFGVPAAFHQRFRNVWAAHRR